MIHKMGFDTQCSCCGRACMFDDVNDEGECAECRYQAHIRKCIEYAHKHPKTQKTAPTRRQGQTIK